MRTDVRTVPPAEDVGHVIWSIQMPAGNEATDKCPPACGRGKEYDIYREGPAAVVSWCQAAERSRHIFEET